MFGYDECLLTAGFILALVISKFDPSWGTDEIRSSPGSRCNKPGGAYAATSLIAILTKITP